MPTKLKLVEFIASKLNKFLRGFQTDQPMVPFLCDVLKDLLTSIMKMFILTDTIKKADTTMKLLKIDVSDKNIHKPSETIDVGMGAQLHISQFRRSGDFKGSSFRNFHQETVLFLSSVTSHMIEKCPLKHMIIRCCSSINPNRLAIRDEREVLKLRFSKMLEKLTFLGQVTPKVAEDAKEQFSKLIDDVVPEHQEKFLSFEKFDQRLDTFFAQFLKTKGFESLWSIFKLVFCLSHGQSAIERGFKANKEFIKENQSECSLKSLRILHDHMIAKEVRAHNIPITRELVKSVKCARSRYVEINNEKKKLKVDSGKALKRKVISTEIEEVQRKKQFLQTSINTLIKDADELALKAHTNADFQILGRSNDLRMLANTKKEQFDKLVQMEQALILRKDSIV
ncbi:uncharacterized protein LOC130614515 [Hydractinia symbiolongicarpus]|uniref:uncharacterized protein LOC130614515 n=1 Tax=Hydractinia symbiolongicarpus TaxID=13093 RepID=UPI0025509FEF|nr:uncharacterized protein LOC130614515 [Hydractinia symbiolongicarpus]